MRRNSKGIPSEMRERTHNPPPSGCCVRSILPCDDVRQAEGGFAALEFLQECVAAKAEFGEQVVRRAHELVFAEALDPMTRGSYRTVEVEITGTPFQPTPAAYVPERMGLLVSSIARSRKHAALKAALFHLEIENIPPSSTPTGGRVAS